MTEVPVRTYLASQVERLLLAVDAGDRRADELLRFAGVEREDMTENVARFVIAVDHWYPDWETAAADSGLVDLDFERAADAVHAGDLGVLVEFLDAKPRLIAARSAFPHHATLLNYVAGNGVEVERQIGTAANAVEVARLLLDRGADADATCDTYGGGSGQTTLTLLVSSSHPAEAGVQGALVEELCRGGAEVNGLDDDGLPMWTAILSGYPDAVDALHRAGARIDNAVFSAAVGEVDLLDWHLKARTPLSVPGPGVELATEHLLECALIYAAGLGRREIVERLLTRNPDLAVRDPVWDSTALGMARYHHRAELISLLGG